MKRLLVVAPEICSPWTEGRKNLVRDLIDELSKEYELVLLTSRHNNDTDLPDCRQLTRHCRHPLCALFHIRSQLPKLIKTFQPDGVFHFPYGSFRSVRGPVNSWIIQSVEKVCLNSGVKCLTILYSADKRSALDKLSGKITNLVVGPGSEWEGKTLDLGINSGQWPVRPERRPDSNRLLFMAGMWQPNLERLEHVIQRRGLGLLLQAGKRLSDNGVRLTVACPLFSSPHLKNALLTHRLNTWPEEMIDLQPVVKVPDIYYAADLFIFPYQADIPVFRPTSVIEAMMAGTATVLSDKPFLKRSMGIQENTYWFRADDQEDLATTILAALENPAGIEIIACKAQAYALSHWAISRTAGELIRLLDTTNDE